VHRESDSAPSESNFDSAGRVTSITQGSSSISFTTDPANRPQTASYYPENIVATYESDSANELTSLSFLNIYGFAPQDTLSITYDSVGRKVSRSGNLATFVPPASVTQTTFDAANRLTSWNNQALAYDGNGNLQSFAGNSYGWNARGQLVSFGSQESLSYDALSRLASTQVGSGESAVTTSFLYDGFNPAYVTQGSTSTQNVLGLGLDEIYGQNQPSMQYAVIRDDANNVAAEASSASVSRIGISNARPVQGCPQPCCALPALYRGCRCT